MCKIVERAIIFSRIVHSIRNITQDQLDANFAVNADEDECYMVTLHPWEMR